jgi:hypothetical protein
MAGHSQRRVGHIRVQRRKKDCRSGPVLSLRNRIHRCCDLLRDKPQTPNHHRKTNPLRHTLRRHRSSDHEPRRSPALGSPQTRVLRKSLRDATVHPHLLRGTSNRTHSRSLHPIETRAKAQQLSTSSHPYVFRAQDPPPHSDRIPPTPLAAPHRSNPAASSSPSHAERS